MRVLGDIPGGVDLACRDPRLAESDLYGVDVSRHLIAEAEHRKAQGVFANPNVFFAQRNLLTAPVFPDATVPVVQFSVNALQPLDYHLDIGARLAPLQRQGVLVVASGYTVARGYQKTFGEQGGSMGVPLLSARF